MGTGFLKLQRSADTAELLHDHAAFALLAWIAYRARWKPGVNTQGLRCGQALVGDWRAMGFSSEKRYRTAKKRLSLACLVRFEGTNKGTVATLLSADVFDVVGRAGGEPGADQGRARGEPGASQGRLTKTEDGKEGGQDPAVFPSELRASKQILEQRRQKHYRDFRLDEAGSREKRPNAWTEYERLQDEIRNLETRILRSTGVTV